MTPTILEIRIVDMRGDAPVHANGEIVFSDGSSMRFIFKSRYKWCWLVADAEVDPDQEDDPEFHIENDRICPGRIELILPFGADYEAGYISREQLEILLGAVKDCWNASGKDERREIFEERYTALLRDGVFTPEANKGPHAEPYRKNRRARISRELEERLGEKKGLFSTLACHQMAELFEDLILNQTPEAEETREEFLLRCEEEIAELTRFVRKKNSDSWDAAMERRALESK